MKGRHIIPLAATAALAVGGTLAGMPAAHADWYGTITGKVLNADGTPAEGVTVYADGVSDGNAATGDGYGDTSEDGYGSGTTDRNGVYRIDIVRNNTYNISLPPYYSDPDANAATPAPAGTTGQAVGTQGAVTAGPQLTVPAPTPDGAAIPPPADYSAVISLSGAAATKEYAELIDPVKGTIYDAMRGQYTWDSTTATSTFHPFTDGRFYFGVPFFTGETATPVPAGSYKVGAFGPDGHIFSGNKPSERDATVVAVTGKTDLGSLAVPSDEIDGSVTGHVAVPRIPGFDEWYGYVSLVDVNGNAVGVDYNSSTDAAGNFSIDVAPGTYYVRAYGGASQVYNFGLVAGGTADTTTGTNTNDVLDYTTATSWYGGKTLATAKKIVVKANGTVSNINFNLTDALQPIVKPMITGKFKKGKKISVTTGDWNKPNNLAFTYTWKEGSKVVGTSSHLKLSKKVWKKAKKLTVVINVVDKDGDLTAANLSLKVKKTIKAQIKAAKKQLKQDTKKDKKALKQASKV